MTILALIPAGLEPWLAPGAAVLSLAAVVVSVVALARPRNAPGRPPAVPADASDCDGLARRLATLEQAAPAAVQRMGLVRFDAFPGAGGQFSFSAALLDGHADGLLLTAISGREETRLYAKRLEAGASQQPLSPEELRALEAAMSSERGR